MPFALQLHFDSDFETAVTSLWQQLEHAEVPSLLPSIGNRPHLTLATFADMSEKQRLLLNVELPDIRRSLNVSFTALEWFSGDLQTVFLAPVLDNCLRLMQQDTLELLDALGIETNVYYQPNRWIPHCTLSKELNPVDALKTIEICQQLLLPITARVAEIALIEYRPVRVLATASC